MTEPDRFACECHPDSWWIFDSMGWMRYTESARHAFPIEFIAESKDVAGYHGTLRIIEEERAQ